MKRYVMNDVINEDGDVVSYLNISGLRTLDGGVYRCEATSLIGSAFHEDKINVIGKFVVLPHRLPGNDLLVAGFFPIGNYRGFCIDVII